MAAITPHAAHATFVNSFHCAPADQDEVVRINVEIVEQVAKHFPGFVSASVHRGTEGTIVINYLQWETAEHLAAMQRSPEFQAVARQLAGLTRFEPHQCDVVHVADAR